MRPRLIDASGVLLILTLAALLAAACGLPSPYSLSPPTCPEQAVLGEPWFKIESTTDNSESEFRGFELYYKCYLKTVDIESNYGSLSSESTLRSAGFLPVCSETDTSPSAHSVPLIPIALADRGKSFRITVDFDSLGGGTYEATYAYTRPDTAIVVSKGVRRYVVDTPVSCKTFDFGQFSAADLDYGKIKGTVPSGGPFYIAMYALSYGLQDIATPIWSWPVYLGYVEICS